jgi:hypothetical protein
MQTSGKVITVRLKSNSGFSRMQIDVSKVTIGELKKLIAKETNLEENNIVM